MSLTYQISFVKSWEPSAKDLLSYFSDKNFITSSMMALHHKSIHLKNSGNHRIRRTEDLWSLNRYRNKRFSFQVRRNKFPAKFFFASFSSWLASFVCFVTSTKGAYACALLIRRVVFRLGRFMKGNVATVTTARSNKSTWPRAKWQIEHQKLRSVLSERFRVLVRSCVVFCKSTYCWTNFRLFSSPVLQPCAFFFRGFNSVGNMYVFCASI